MASTLERNEREGVTVLTLHGSLTVEGTAQIAPQFESAARQPGARVVVDLSGVDILTTPALSMFVAAASDARDSGGRIVFAAAGPNVRALLERLRLTLVLHTADDMEQAMAEVRT